jgi:hypothetical protein
MNFEKFFDKNIHEFLYHDAKMNAKEYQTAKIKVYFFLSFSLILCYLF